MTANPANGFPDSRTPGTLLQETVLEPPVKRKRKIGGPFRRSRTGCGTCRRRGKKCDEDWSEQGFCQRCIAGAWVCLGRTDSGSNDRQGRIKSPHANNGSERPSTDSHEGPAGDESITDSPDIPSTSKQTTLPDRRPPPTSDIPPVSGTTHQVSQDFSHQLDTARLTTNQPSIPTPPLTSSSSIGISPAGSLSFSQPLFEWQNGNGSTSAFLNSFADGSLSIDSGQTDWSSAFAAPFGQQAQWNWPAKQQNGLSTITDDLYQLFGLTPSPKIPHQTTADSGTHSIPEGRIDETPRVVFVNNGHRPTRRGVSLAEIYARVVESWLVGLPSATRDYARARILALNDSNSIMRAVRYAVATAYIFLYAADPQGGHEPQPKLVELAYRGAGVFRRDATDTRGSTPNPSPSTDASTPREPMSKKLRLYVDTVSTPFSSDSESARWTHEAIQELTRVVVKEKAQLSDLLWGVIDLQLVEFIRGGAAPSYDMLALGDRLVQAAYNESHPTITLSQLRSSETLSLRLFAISDISRCIAHRKRRTLFNFHLDDTATQPVSDTDEEEPWAAYLGLQDPIVVLMAEVVNLCADMSTVSMSTVLSRAEAVEQSIRNWQPAPPAGSAASDATAVISRTIAGQLWRLCALILLYQSVHQVGTLHPALRKAKSEMLSLLDSIVRLPNGDLWGFIALPSFLAATLSTDEPDRRRAMQHMLRPGPEKMWLDNVALVEKVWEEVDETGRTVDWFDKMQREGMSVAFF